MGTPLHHGRQPRPPASSRVNVETVDNLRMAVSAGFRVADSPKRADFNNRFISAEDGMAERPLPLFTYDPEMLRRLCILFQEVWAEHRAGSGRNRAATTSGSSGAGGGAHSARDRVGRLRPGADQGARAGRAVNSSGRGRLRHPRQWRRRHAPRLPFTARWGKVCGVWSQARWRKVAKIFPPHKGISKGLGGRRPGQCRREEHK